VGSGCAAAISFHADRARFAAPPVEPAHDHPETAMSIARSLSILLVAASVGGCASITGRPARMVEETAAISPTEELALIRLADLVDEAGRAARFDGR
jgi:hypothetical protein